MGFNSATLRFRWQTLLYSTATKFERMSAANALQVEREEMEIVLGSLFLTMNKLNIINTNAEFILAGAVIGEWLSGD